MFEKFRQRSFEPENIDKGTYTPEEYEGCLVELRRVNEWLGDTDALRDSLLREIDRAGLQSFSVLDVGAGSGELLRAVRGERVLPAVGLREQARAAARLDPRDRPIFAMRLAGTTPRDIANVVGMTVAALNARVQAIVAQLAAPRATALA